MIEIIYKLLNQRKARRRKDLDKENNSIVDMWYMLHVWIFSKEGKKASVGGKREKKNKNGYVDLD